MTRVEKKSIQIVVILLGIAILSSCGGDAGEGDDTMTDAIKIIADYAASTTNIVPTALDYQHAGISNVYEDSIATDGNLAAINAMISKGTRSDYDTVPEIQALVDFIGQKAVPDRNFGDGIHDFIYGVVTNQTTGYIWLNNNLGASYSDANDPNFDPQQQATSPTDFLAYGSLFQWGRKADGHELIHWTGSSSGTPSYSATLTQKDTPTDSLFIKSSDDWRVTADDTLWSNALSPNKICPVNYRLPDQSDIILERYTWASGMVFTVSDAFSSELALTTPGLRRNIDAQIAQAGSKAYYWTSTTMGTNAYFLNIYNTASEILNSGRAWGMSVRCIRRYP